MGEKRFLGKKMFCERISGSFIGTLSMRVNKFDKNTGKVTEKNENPVLKIAKRKEQIDSRVQLVADYVVLHPREKYTPQKMAEMVELSKQRFSSLFKANICNELPQFLSDNSFVFLTLIFINIWFWGTDDYGKCIISTPNNSAGSI